MTVRLLPPHGGRLVHGIADAERRALILEQAPALPHVQVTAATAADIEMIAVGAFSPLTGFMSSKDYHSVVSDMRLSNGLVWTLPITLAVGRAQAATLREGQDVILDFRGIPVALLHLAEMFTYDKEQEAAQVYRTTDGHHPGVARLYAQGDILLAGDIELLNRPHDGAFGEYWRDPSETRSIFAERGWRRIVAFQTRNPTHRAHEYIQKCALEICDGLLFHPLVGETKDDDVPADVRMQSYERLISTYYPRERVLLSVFPAAMHYAGPREAIFHAICRKNYGCTHFIVGRDHAGVGSYYGSYDAHYIFDEFRPEELGITPLFFEHTFYCRACGSMASPKTCPHDTTHHIVLSGSRVRAMLEAGEVPPPEVTRPEVAEVLISTRRRKRMPRILVIGLDCADPHLVFDRWLDDLPTLRHLQQNGLWGRLTSSIPAITVPAWMSMMTSKDPGQLGLYGFRNRSGYSYRDVGIVSSASVRDPTLWDILGDHGWQVTVVGVPPSYPPKPVQGRLITCFLTPGKDKVFTYPESLANEVQSLVGEYMFDVKDFRTHNKDYLLQQITLMTERRHAVVKHLLVQHTWDFFMVVEMGTDRMHHGFWHYMDPTHPRHEYGSPYAHAIKDYYRQIDRNVGELLTLVPDDTIVLVVSDHGARPMLGGVCINEWLRQEGYLTLRSEPEGITPLEACDVDWSRTIAWGAGGYYGRLFINVQGREPQGLVPPPDFARVRDEIATRLEAMMDHHGQPMGTRCFVPQRIYQECRNIPPDLIVYFGDLAWRSVGSVGHGGVLTFANDTGPDEANHAQEGMFILYDPGHPGGRADAHIMDIAPTLLRRVGVAVPGDMRGRILE